MVSVKSLNKKFQDSVHCFSFALSVWVLDMSGHSQSSALAPKKKWKSQFVDDATIRIGVNKIILPHTNGTSEVVFWTTPPLTTKNHNDCCWFLQQARMCRFVHSVSF